MFGSWHGPPAGTVVACVACLLERSSMSTASRGCQGRTSACYRIVPLASFIRTLDEPFRLGARKIAGWWGCTIATLMASR